MNRGSLHRVDAYARRLKPSELETVTASAAGGLFVWPELFASLGSFTQALVLARFVSDDRPPCLYGELAAAHLERIHQRLPGVWARVGTFPTDSGPNCFGAVIESFTGETISNRTERDNFTGWLNQRQPRHGDEMELGAVLLWYDDQNTLQHAAVSFGESYVFHKEAQTWWSPWQVVQLAEVVERWQDVGVMSAVSLAN